MRAILPFVLAFGLFAMPTLQAQSPREKGPEQSGAGDQSGANAPEKDLTGWMWANFLVLAGVLTYFGVKLGTPYFRSQTDSIGKGVSEARQRREAAELRAAEVDRKLANLGAEIEQLRSVVLAEQSAQAERMLDQAETDMQRVHANAKQQVETAGKNARMELQRFASRLAMEIAEQQARSRMNAAVQQDLTDQFVESLRS